MEEELDTKFFEIKEKYSQQNERDTICLQERRCGEEKTDRHAIFSEAMLNDICFAKVSAIFSAAIYHRSRMWSVTGSSLVDTYFKDRGLYSALLAALHQFQDLSPQQSPPKYYWAFFIHSCWK